jgi:two-component system alkaline phosphatase synthesis response regulator PhoP
MGKKILIIEDEPDQRTIVDVRLKAAGYDVITASDGEEGLLKARNEDPDLILLDIVIPKRDGLEVCATLKSEAGRKRIPIIMLTAYGIDNIEEKSFAVGADDCIRKPYESKELLQKIKSLLAA